MLPRFAEGLVIVIVKVIALTGLRSASQPVPEWSIRRCTVGYADKEAVAAGRALANLPRCSSRNKLTDWRSTPRGYLSAMMCQHPVRTACWCLRLKRLDRLAV